MKKQEQCMIPVFFVMCFALLAVLGGCGREAAFRFETAETPALTESHVPAETASGGNSSGEDEAAETAASEPEEPEMIWVYVCGAVRVPGVYELPAGGRVYQALDAAGGPLEGAELRSLNQAALLSDGEQITVYTAEEMAETGGVQPPGAEAQAGTGKVDLNTAGKEELMTLSGIGEARAQAIINYRETHGPFSAIEEIMNIEGIKEKAFSKIKDEIEV